MKYTLPALALAISAVLSGCAATHTSPASQPVAEQKAETAVQPLKRELAEGLYEMALSPKVMHCTLPALKALKMCRAARCTSWIRQP